MSAAASGWRGLGASVATGVVVMVAIAVAAGEGALRPELAGLALIAGVSFFDLARRGFAESGLGSGDRTDVWMSAAFAVVLVAAAWDHGRDAPPGWHGAVERGLLAVGIVCMVTGLALRVWTARTLGRDYLVRLDLRAEHRLVESGPFRRLRNPAYAGLLLVAVGTSLAFVSPLAVAVTLVLWLPLMLVRVEREERLLLAHYGSAYERYRDRTARLIPGVY